MKSLVLSVVVASLAANLPGAALGQSAPAPAAGASAEPPRPLVHLQPDPSDALKAFMVDPALTPAMSRDDLIAALRKKVRYVFVVFNENHSFDNEYGSFPGVDGLFSDGTAPRDAAHTPGFVQHYKDWQGQDRTAEPFLIGPAQNATFLDSVDHSHKGLAKKIDVGPDGTARMDGFAATEYGRFVASGGAKSANMARNYADMVMSYVDCDTIPLFWTYAKNFTIFDNIFATEDTPSTPNAIAMIAGQAGETQWVKHGTEGKSYTAGENKGTTQGAPLVNDPQPFYGSQFDTTAADRQPAGSRDGYKNTNIATNQTYATVPLTMAGRNATRVTSGDYNADFDLADIGKDIPFITSRGGAPSPGAGTRKATITSRWTARARPRTTATSAITRGRNISATSPTIRISRRTCAASVTSSPTSRPASCRKTAASSTCAAASRRSRRQAADPEPLLPEPRRPHAEGAGHDRLQQGRRRRPSRLFGPAAQRGHGGPRDQRRGRRPRDLGAVGHHHHL